MLKQLRLAAIALLVGWPALAQVAAPVPAPAARTAPAAAARSTAAQVDINGASERQLDALPGIGPVRAKAIIAGRPYADLQDLVAKKVLTQGVFDGAKDRMALANINVSSAADMQRSLPGIGEVRSKAIVTGRPYAKPEDLVGKGVLTQDLFDKIKGLIVL